LGAASYLSSVFLRGNRNRSGSVGVDISAAKSLEQTNEIQQITYTPPRSGRQKTKLLKLNQQQQNLLKIIE